MLNGRCSLHGGKTPTGIASPQFQTGRYSKYLPGRLLERYQQSVGDTELLNLREDIALLDSRIADLLGRVDSGESADAWKKAQSAWKAFTRASDLDEKKKLQDELTDLLSFGLRDTQAWAELESVLQDRRKLVESERKRLVEMQQSITAEQAMTLIAALTDTVKRHVTDRATLAAIALDLARLTAAGAAQPALSA